MRFMLIVGIILTSLGVHAESSHSDIFTQTITVGHFEVVSLEIKKDIKKSQWTLKLNRNGQLSNGRAITKETYERIQKDWRKVFIDQKNNGTCSDPIIVDQSHGKDLNRQAICLENWSKSQKEKFNKFYFKLQSLTIGKTLTYE